MIATRQNPSGTPPQSSHTGPPWRPLAWGAAGALLLLPLVAMQFTDEVKWTGSDFMIFGLMLAAGGGLIELAVHTTGNLSYRAGVAIAVLASFLLLWVNGAVGIIGNEENPANLMFGGVLLVVIAGALVSRGRPRGLARTMVAAATVQGLIALITSLLGLGHILVVTAGFMVLWLLAGALFHRSLPDRA